MQRVWGSFYKNALYKFTVITVIITPGIGYWHTGSEETRMMGLLDDRKHSKIGLKVSTQYWHVTVSQPAMLL